MEQIKASPKYGRYLNKKLKVFFAIEMTLCIILNIISILISILSIIGVIEYEKDLILSLAIYAVLAIIGFIVLLMRLLQQRKFELYLKMCKDDFIKVYASISISTALKSLFQEYSVTARFNYEGHSFFIEESAGNNIKGFDRILKQCTGNNIPIYYSPTYNEFVFIKES